ncbi:MAG: phosphoglycerate kinase [Bacteroidia bacterium]
MKSLKQANIQGRRALVRVDFNVPLNENKEVTDDRRIAGAAPSINHILEQGGSAVLMAHFGRPKGVVNAEFSLRQTLETVRKHVKGDVLFADDCIGEEAFEMSSNLKPGQVLLLENVRFYPQEKKGDEVFAEQLSRHGDFYVNDAFGAAHRAHASTSTVAQFFEDKYAGFLMEQEVANAQKVLDHAEHPVVAIMGGAKVSDKIQIIENLMDTVDYFLIGGGMAFTFLRSKGYRIGKSLLELEHVNTAASLIKTGKRKNTTILTPVDSVVSDVFGEGGKVDVVRNEDFPDDMMGLDIGPKTFEYFYDTIMDAKTILWNGPMGVFEMETFSKGTEAVARAVAAATKKGAFSLIGGGDSAAAIAKFDLEDQVSYVSTGGGALLEFLEGKVLPGVAALQS